MTDPNLKGLVEAGGTINVESVDTDIYSSLRGAG